MAKMIVTVPGILIALGAIMLSMNSTEARAQAARVDPAAVEILQRMTKYVSTLEKFSVHAENTFEDVLDSGQRVDFDIAANVVVHRPNQLRAERVGELINQVFYYDGKSLTLYKPSDGVYATQPAPGTIEELLDYVREGLGMNIPVSDLVYRNAFAILIENVQSAVVIGKALIGGRTCDHLAFRRPDVDFQVWVADGNQPLPCKYVVTDTSTPELISTVTVMSDWNVGPTVADSEFKFVAPRGANPIKFMPLDNTSGFGR